MKINFKPEGISFRFSGEGNSEDNIPLPDSGRLHFI